MSTGSKPMIRLPEGWQRHVRSAVLHVISRAQYAMVYARNGAVDSLNGRVRLMAQHSPGGKAPQ